MCSKADWIGIGGNTKIWRYRNSTKIISEALILEKGCTIPGNVQHGSRCSPKDICKIRAYVTRVYKTIANMSWIPYKRTIDNFLNETLTKYYKANMGKEHGYTKRKTP